MQHGTSLTMFSPLPVNHRRAGRASRGHGHRGLKDGHPAGSGTTR